MKKHFISSVILFSILLQACHNKGLTQSTTTTATNNTGAADAVKSISVDPKSDLTSTGDPYTVDSMSVNGDILSIFVNYGGGCKEHTFELVSDGMYAKSLPPQVTICLKHTNNSDNCRKLVMRELKFDVSKLKSPGHKTVSIKLGDKQINYSAQ